MSNFALSFCWWIFLLLLWKWTPGWIRGRSVLILYILILCTIGFAKFPKLNVNFVERYKFLSSIGIFALIFISSLATIGINIQDRLLLIGGTEKTALTNIILISIDSLRSDHLGSYGYERNTSPNIDKLAEDGILFENTISTTTWTLPAHISMLTGLLPEVHQVINDGNRLSEQVRLCSEILKERGYVTTAFVSGPYMHSEFGFNRGFDFYDDHTIYHPTLRDSHSGITSPKINSRVKAWLKRYHTNSFFLFVHYWDVHYDYTPPPPFDMMFDPDYKGDITGENFEGYPNPIEPSMSKRDLEHIIALYDGEIAFTDLHIGRLFAYLKELKIYDKTLIILTADHGDEFFEHGNKGHRKTLFDETLKVPLIIKLPSNQWNGKRIKKHAQIIDIVPTFLSHLSFNVNTEFQGINLLSAIADKPDNPDNLRFADLHGKLKCVRTNEMKFIINLDTPDKMNLFMLESDKAEKYDVALSSPILVKTMHEALVEWLRRADIMAEHLGATRFNYGDDLKNRLKSLGYVE
jgi:arylsulfatase A-like enzyme